MGNHGLTHSDIEPYLDTSLPFYHTNNYISMTTCSLVVYRLYITLHSERLKTSNVVHFCQYFFFDLIFNLWSYNYPFQFSVLRENFSSRFLVTLIPFGKSTSKDCKNGAKSEKKANKDEATIRWNQNPTSTILLNQYPR